MDRNRRVYSILLSLVAIWCGLIVAAPLLHGVSESSSSLLYKFFARICHQLDERSFHVAGGKFAVCIRCSAIYFGFLAGIVLIPLVKGLGRLKLSPLRWLYFAMLPMLVDVVFNVSGLHSSTDFTRLVTGSLLGFVLPWYILPVLFESLSSLSTQNMKGAPHYARKTE
jgi:uncharacterized membrane protein